MRQLDEAAFQALTTLFQEVSFRADRLREWTEMEYRLRHVEATLLQFSKEVRSLKDVEGFAGNSDRLDHLWTQHIWDLGDLKSFAGSIRHINKPLSVADTGDPVAPGSKFDVGSLNDLASKINDALTSGQLTTLKESTQELQTQLNAKIADRRNITQQEIHQLCELTYRLRERLE